jgi:hypothetical protein
MRFGKLLGLTLIAAPLAAYAQPAGIEPGQWEIAVTINAADMPSAPPAVAKMMVGRTTTIKHCITPEDAARGPQDLLKPGKSCTFTRYNMKGGKLDSEVVCQQGGSTVTAVSTGSFTPTGFTATGRSTTSGGMAMTVDSTSVGRRVGDCGK